MSPGPDLCPPVKGGTMFWISESFGDGHLLVSLHGELDICEEPSARKSLAAAVAVMPYVIIDLSGLLFMDCAGIRVLAGLHRTTEALGGWLVLATPRGTVLRLLEILGADELFLIWELRDGAEDSRPGERRCGNARIEAVRDLGPGPRARVGDVDADR